MLTGPGMLPTPIATQPNQNVREETVTPKLHDEPISRTTNGSVTPGDELAPSSVHRGQFDNELVESLEEIIKDYQNQNIESVRAIVNVMQLIFNHPFMLKEEKEQAFNEYATTIGAIGQQWNQAAK